MMSTEKNRVIEMFDHSKLNTEEIDITKSKSSISFGINYLHLENPKISFFQNDGKNLVMPIVEPALRQVTALAGKYSWNVMNLINQVVDPELKQLGMDLINRRIQHSRGMSRMHVLDDEIQGITSTNYKKIYNRDLMDMIDNSVGEENFQRAFHSDYRTTMSYKVGDFKDPVGEDWDINLRVENNEFGRHSIVLRPEVVRVICTNGMVMTKFSQNVKLKHYGIIKLDSLDTAINFIVDHLNSVEKIISESIDLKIANEEEFWKKVKKKFHLNQTDLDAIFQFIKEEDPHIQDTVYAAGQAVSAYAHEFENQDRWYELQEIAGTIYQTPAILMTS